MAKDNVMDFNLEEFDFEAIAGDIFGEDVTTAKLNPDLQGKVILIYGENSVGKTKQASRMVQKSFLIPLEQGTNALGGGTQILRTGGWADAKKHARKLATNKTLLKALKAGVAIGIIIDGIDNIPVLAKQYICNNAGVDKFSKAGAHGSQWEEYANEIFYFFHSLLSVGYTIIGIGHPYESKEDAGYLDLLDDKRAIKPIKDSADFCFYVEASGQVDEEGRVVPSRAYLAKHAPTETEWGFFARSRFPYVQTFFEEWDADIVRQAIYDGIVKQAEVEGAQLVGFAEVAEKYQSTFTLTYEDAMNQIFEMLEECDGKGLTEKADDVLLQYLDKADDVNNLKEKQMQTIQSIHDELEHLLSLN